MSRVVPANQESIETAARVLRAGGVIIFPTETVYGIGADVRQPAAVRRVFELKRRPAGMPLLAHCGDAGQLNRLVTGLPATARVLAGRFWPGPLALVLRRGAFGDAAVAGGGETIGVRMTSCPFAAALARRLGAAIAGTSANRHGRPAAASFAGLDPELVAEVDLAVDAGDCGSGAASTLVDLTTEPPRLLRAGAVGVPEIEAALGRKLERG